MMAVLDEGPFFHGTVADLASTSWSKGVCSRGVERLANLRASNAEIMN